jgi:hypothetical protein
MEPEGTLPCSQKVPQAISNILQQAGFYGEELLDPRPTTKLEDHSLSAVRNYLSNIFAATLHTWRPFAPSCYSMGTGESFLRCKTATAWFWPLTSI